MKPGALEILRHATGWPACYRNRYLSAPDGDLMPLLLELEADGLMERMHPPAVGELIGFFVTPREYSALQRAEVGK